MKTRIVTIIGFLTTVFFLTTPRNAQKYIVLNTFDVNIRTGPGIENYIVCTAGKGEIFELVGENGDWLEIKMFSPDNRFLHRDMVYFLEEFVPGHNMHLPEKQKIREIQNAAQWAKTVSFQEAEEIIPKSINEERYLNFRSICLDKNMHHLFEIHGLQTAMFFQIINHKEKRN